MKDPDRLAVSGSPRSKSVLAAARRYRPSDRSRHALLAGLGVGGTLKVAAASSGFFGTLLGKAALFVVGVVVVGASVRALAPPRSAAEPTATSLAPTGGGAEITSKTVPALEATEPVPSAPEAQPDDASPALIAPPLARISDARSSASSHALLPPVASGPASSSAAPEARAPSLATAIRVLDDARGRLTASRPREALAILDSNRAALASSPLASQATVVRVEALMASGDTVRARQEGDAFLSHHPTGPLSDRVRQLVGKLP